MAEDRSSKSFQWSCPAPASGADRIQLAHGGGGRMTRDLIESLFLPAFANALLEERHDGAVFAAAGRRLAFTTDSYVVQPLEFPGGDIGSLAVNGTVNDLAMCGARPLYLSAGLILEEGLPVDLLRRVVTSMREAARQAGAEIVTGDTKVVDKGKGDGIFINTAGIGVVEVSAPVSPARVRPGDAVIVSGDLGRHGIAVLSCREGLAFDASIASDCAPLWEPVNALIRAGIEIHCLRDLTRGGLASALNEIALAAGVGVSVDEAAVPVAEAVHAACELLGLDPLCVANEGRFIAVVPAGQADETVRILRRCEVSGGATSIGRVTEESPGMVILRSAIGGSRVLDLLSGEQLPRIC